MAERAKKYDKRKDFQRTAEELIKEKERVRKLKKTLSEQTEATHDGRFKVTKVEGSSLEGFDRLLDALIREHPEKDPAKTK